MSTVHCKNCGKSLNGLYCSHCGQKAKAGRITFDYLWRQIFHFFTHIESGFLFTSAKLIIHPGKTINDFIEGKRKSYQPPVSYFLIWITIYILSLYWIEITFGENTVISYGEYFGPAATTKYAISHLSMVLAVVIPFQALYFYLLVGGSRYNYFESLVTAIYAIGTIIQLQFAFVVAALLLYFVSASSVDLLLSDAIKAVYLAYFILNFLRLFPVKGKIFRVLLFVLLVSGTFTVWRLYGVPHFTNWFINASHSITL